MLEKSSQAKIEAAAAAHRASLTAVPNQMGFPADPKYLVCGCPDSKPKKCVCNPENFNKFVCGHPVNDICSY